MKLVFDLESDNLLNEATTVWVLITQDIETGEIMTFTDYDDNRPSMMEGLAHLSFAEVLIGHNIIGFDIPMLKKIYGWEPTSTTRIHDTWIMTQVLSYNRNHKAGLEGWGKHLGFTKIEYDDWTQYTEAMRVYCQRDVELNTKVYEILLEELNVIREKRPTIADGLRVEHDIAKFNAFVRMRGWNFDMAKAQDTIKRIEMEMSIIEHQVEPKLGTITRLKDKDPKTPKYTKAGNYTAASARMIGEFLGREVRPTEALLPEPPMKPGEEFQRSVEEKASLGNLNNLKEYLLTIGWEPDDWNVKNVYGNWVQTGPKLTSTSLAKLGQIGLDIDRWTTLRNRRSVIEGWMDHAANDGRLRGNMWTIGTPTFRCRHEVIVNLPGVKTPYGREIRELLIPEEGQVIVGADSSGNQFRALAHYLKNPKFTDDVINGDVHQRNADNIGCDRDTAKTFTYAMIFGAGNANLGRTLTGYTDQNAGREGRRKLMNGIDGFEDFVNKARTFVERNGYIPGLDGRKVYVRKEFQALNYLLQSAEAITCKAAVSYSMKKIEEEGLEAEPRFLMHDEQAWSVSKKDAARVKEILEESYREAPKTFGIDIMDGEGKIGANYAESH